MSQRANSLQAALAGAAVEESVAKPKMKGSAAQGRAVKTVPVKKAAKPAPKEKKASTGRYRDSTVMVGGHFPPHVLRQLRMIAAEESTTNQALIAEALDLLFTRKGKSKIADLSTG